VHLAGGLLSHPAIAIKVQNSSKTTLSRSCASVSGAELIQSAARVRKLGSSGSGGALTAAEERAPQTNRATPCGGLPSATEARALA